MHLQTYRDEGRSWHLDLIGGRGHPWSIDLVVLIASGILLIGLRLRLRGIADPLADGTAATPGSVPRAAARVLEVDPNFTISGWIARGGQSNSHLLIEGLRKAGLPE